MRQLDLRSPTIAVPDSFGPSGEANPGAPWGATELSASGGAGDLDTLYTDINGNVFEGPTAGPSAGPLQPVFPRSADARPFEANMSLDPSGKSIVYVGSGGNLFVASASTGGNIIRWELSGDDPQWSPNGALIAYVTSDGGLAIVNANGTGGGKILYKLPRSQTDNIDLESPSWFPDSQSIAAILPNPNFNGSVRGPEPPSHRCCSHQHLGI